MAGVALGDEPTLLQESYFGADGECVRSFMGGHDGLDGASVNPGLKAFEKGVGGRTIECRKGFIEEQERGLGREGSGEGDTLGFTA
jgi:hypothetical protein